MERFGDNLKQLAETDPYRLWSGLAALSATVERKIWMITRLGRLCPNIYTILVGPPGSNKTASIKMAESQLLDETMKAPTKVTPAALHSFISSARKEFQYQNSVLRQSPVSAFVHELSDFATDLGGGSILPDLMTYYDSPGHLHYNDFIVKKTTRTYGTEAIVNPSLTLLAGTTPGYLNSAITRDLGAQGLHSRVFFIYPNSIQRQSYFSDEKNEPLFTKEQLVLASRKLGPVTLDGTVLDAIRGLEDYAENKQKQFENTGSFWEFFYTRYVSNGLKLAMLLSSLDNLKITPYHIDVVRCLMESLEKAYEKNVAKTLVTEQIETTNLIIAVLKHSPDGLTLPGVVLAIEKLGFVLYNDKKKLVSLVQYLIETNKIKANGDRIYV